MGLLKPLIVRFLKGNWGKILPLIFKAAAEGQFGEQVKTVYWWLAGKKTVTGAILFGVGLGFEGICSSYPEIPSACTVFRIVYGIGGILFAAGLADGGTRSPWPEGTPKEN